MIDLYTAPTPTGWRLSIALEELGLAYRVHAIDISKGEQHKPEFLAISPIGKIPAIVDQDGPNGEPIALFGSGPALIYLAEKTGRLLPTDARQRLEALEWLFMAGNDFAAASSGVWVLRNFVPDATPATQAVFEGEFKRYLAALDRRLKGREFLAAGQYTIADIAGFTYASNAPINGVDLAPYPELRRWCRALASRPAVAKGREIPG